MNHIQTILLDMDSITKFLERKKIEERSQYLIYELSLIHIYTSEILKLKPSGQINTNDETWAIQNFYKVNRGEATEADIQRTNELIEKIPDSPYYQPVSYTHLLKKLRPQ